MSDANRNSKPKFNSLLKLKEPYQVVSGGDNEKRDSQL